MDLDPTREVEVLHIVSHLQWEEAKQKGYDKRAWWGNQQADALAGEAADEHAIPSARLDCYQWVNAIGFLIRKRIARATLQAIIQDPSMTMEDKELSRKKRQHERELRREKEDIEILVKQSLHVLQHSQGKLSCKVCEESCVDYGNGKRVLKEWLKKKCAAQTTGPRFKRHQVLAGSQTTHVTHDMRHAVRVKRWFCWNCAASFATPTDSQKNCRLSEKLLTPCVRRATKGMEHKLKAFRNQAER